MATIAASVGGLSFGVRTDQRRTAGRIRALLGPLVRHDETPVGSNFSVTTPRPWLGRVGTLYEGGTEVLRSHRLRPILAALAARVSSLQSPTPPLVAADLRAIAHRHGVVLVDARVADIPWDELGREWAALHLRHVHIDVQRHTVVLLDGLEALDWSVSGPRPVRSERALLGLVTSVNEDGSPDLLDAWARALRPRDGWFRFLNELQSGGGVIGARSRSEIADAANSLVERVIDRGVDP